MATLLWLYSYLLYFFRKKSTKKKAQAKRKDPQADAPLQEPGIEMA